MKYLKLLLIAALLSGCKNEPAIVSSSDLPAQKPLMATDEGWVFLGEKDFAKVNSADDTWSFKDGVIYCTGKPVSVMRTAKKYKNFELECEWKHKQYGGNSGIFVWATDASIEKLTKAGKPGLPHGIEVQVLDTGYAAVYTKQTGKKANWFTSHGDVFPVGEAKMKPFPPLSPDGSRSFPKQNTTKDVGNWNHYYIKAVNGEIRLTVNGVEVSGGSDCNPAEGYLCLESEGAPIEFRGLKIRELP